MKHTNPNNTPEVIFINKLTKVLKTLQATKDLEPTVLHKINKVMQLIKPMYEISENVAYQKQLSELANKILLELNNNDNSLNAFSFYVLKSNHSANLQLIIEKEQLESTLKRSKSHNQIIKL